MSARDAQIHSAALFFFFAFLDESVARYATVKAIRGLSRKGKVADADFIATLNRVYFEIVEKGTSHIKPHFEAKSFVGLPDGTKMGPWREFQKSARADEVLAVILTQILGYGINAVSRALAVTPGTVNYRVGRGVRILSAKHLEEAT